MKVGVLALQGAFFEHCHILKKLDVDAVEVRLPEQLDELEGIIIPGGESTTIGKLAVMYNFIEPLREFALSKPIWGTCAGMILLAKKIDFDNQPLLEVMDIVVQRNAFGRQLDSFQADLKVPALENGKSKSFPGVFIRAPLVKKISGNARMLSSLNDGTVVAVQENSMLATSFHPELTNDYRFHKFFLDMIKMQKNI